MGVTNLLSKAVGLAGLGVIAYDSHHEAKEYARRFSINESTRNLEKVYYDTLSLQSKSVVKDKAKKSVLNYVMDHNFDKTAYSITGYIGSIFSSTINNIIPIALSSVALLTKGVASKLSALGTVGYAVLNFFGEFRHKAS